jgi:hypothetical protein
LALVALSVVEQRLDAVLAVLVGASVMEVRPEGDVETDGLSGNDRFGQSIQGRVR